MANGNGNGIVMKTALAAMSSMLITGAAAWFAFGNSTVKASDPMPEQWRDTVKSIVHSESPYRDDQGTLKTKLENIERDQQQMAQDIREIKESLRDR